MMITTKITNVTKIITITSTTTIEGMRVVRLEYVNGYSVSEKDLISYSILDFLPITIGNHLDFIYYSTKGMLVQKEQLERVPDVFFYEIPSHVELDEIHNF